MAIDPITAVEQAQRLDMLAAQEVPTGVTEPLTGPAIDQQPFEVAGRLSPLGDALARFFGGSELSEARRGVIEQRRQLEEAPLAPSAEPSIAPVEPSAPAAPEAPAAPAAPAAPVRPPDEPPTADALEDLVRQARAKLSDEAIEKRVLTQANPIRAGELEADEILSGLVEPRRTELLSDGLTDFTAVGAKGDPKIPDEGNIYALIEGISNKYDVPIDKLKRGKITHAVSMELADYLGTNPQQVLDAASNMRGTGGVPIIEGAGLSETILAVRDLLYTEMSKLDILAEAASDGGPAALLNFRQQLELVSNLQANFKGIQTEIGRSLSLFRVPVGRGRRGASEGVQSVARDMDLAHMLQEFGGEGDLKALANAYRSLPTGRQRVQFTQVSRFRRFTNAAFEVWMNNLLSGPITHTKNFLAAGMTVFAEIPVGLAAATIGTVRRAGGGTGGMTFGEVHAQAFGQMMAMREALSAAGTSFRTGEMPIAGSKLGDFVGAGDARTPAFSAQGFGLTRNSKAQSLFATGVDAIGTFLTLGRIPTRALGFEDTLWKVVAQRGNLWGQAYRLAKEKNLSGSAAAEFMTDFMMNPPAAAVKDADDLARKLTLQQPLESKLGRLFQGGARVGFMRWFVPFIKTPYNAFSFAFEHTPLARFTDNYKNAMASGDQVKIDVARARVGLGSVASIGVASMTAAGTITGGGPADSGLRAALYRKGWQPYSILIGGKYYSYAGAEPYSTIIGLVADAVELVQTGRIEQDDADEILVGVMFSLGKNLSNKTFMQGFANFMNAAMSGERHYAERIVSSFAQTLPPIIGSGISRQSARAIDPYRRDPMEPVGMPREYSDLPWEKQQEYSAALARYDEFAWLNERLGELRANIPGWSLTVPALRDFWGRKVVNEGAFGPDIMSPVYMSVADDTEMEIDGVTYDTGVLDDEMLRLKIGERGHPDDYPGFPFTEEERDFFQERAGVLAVQYLTEAFEHRDYQKFRGIGLNQRYDTRVNSELKLVLQKAIRKARRDAMADLGRHETLGPGFVESWRQTHDLNTMLERLSVEGRPQ